MPVDTMIDTNPGQIRLGSRVIRRHARNYGVLSFTDVIVRSSNVGAIKIGFKVGTERLSRFVPALWIRASGLSRFPGRESRDRLGRRQMDDSALMSVSMGYQVGVTPLQMVAAISSVANGGAYCRAARCSGPVPGQPALRRPTED